MYAMADPSSKLIVLNPVIIEPRPPTRGPYAEMIVLSWSARKCRSSNAACVQASKIKQAAPFIFGFGAGGGNDRLFGV